MKPLVLASTSKYRAALLERLGVPFEAAAPPYEERNVAGHAPDRMVMEQARGKAESLVSTFPNAVIIGSDQVAHLDGAILTKPGSFDRAVEQLDRLQGHEHELLTGVCVIDATSGQSVEHLERSPIRIRSLTRVEIEAYVRADNPVDCAGSYKAESLGVTIFDYQRGDDPTAVVGLPLIALSRLLRELGIDILNRRA